MADVTHITTFQDEPEAHALYDRMVEVTSEASSLYYKSLLDWRDGQEQGACTYRLWIRKRPFGIRAEVHRGGKPTGVLVNDGKQTWLFWPGARPPYRGEDPAEHERTRFTSYAKETPNPAWLKYLLPRVGTRVAPVLEPIALFGIEDSLFHSRDGMRRLGSEQVDGETCDVIEIRHLQGLRVKTLWLERRDGLPRRLAEAIQADSDLVRHEQSVRIRLDEEFPPELFVWEPPEGWEEWRKPDPSARRLQPGTEAPTSRRRPSTAAACGCRTTGARWYGWSSGGSPALPAARRSPTWSNGTAAARTPGWPSTASTTATRKRRPAPSSKNTASPSPTSSAAAKPRGRAR
jgi:hypothetical protein